MIVCVVEPVHGLFVRLLAVRDYGEGASGAVRRDAVGDVLCEDLSVAPYACVQPFEKDAKVDKGRS